MAPYVASFIVLRFVVINTFCCYSEVTLGEAYNEKCDIFSFGIIMFEILTGNTDPYGKNNKFNVELRVAQHEDYRPVIPESFVLERDEQKIVIKLMSLCWSHNPKDRPELDVIISTLEHLSGNHD